MKKVHKADTKLFVALLFSLFFSLFLVWALRVAKTDYEDLIYERYLEKKETLFLEEEIYVLTIPSSGEEALTAAEQNLLLEENYNKLLYLAEQKFFSAKGVFILNTELLSLAPDERSCLKTFRNAGNIFWHYNNKNIGYYHADDQCGQIKFLDEYYGADNCFEVLGNGKYAKNFVPYFLMQMGGNSVSYDAQKHIYTITEPSGEKHTLYALEDGTIRMRKTDTDNVHYYDLDDFYQKVTEQADTKQYENAVFFVQDSSLDSIYAGNLGEFTDLADYYISALGTIQNEATVPTFGIRDTMILVAIGVLVLGLLLILLPFWISVIAYLAEVGMAVAANVLLFQFDICYVPVINFVLGVTLTLLIVGGIRKITDKSAVRNLPIDAVIRFTNTIINIDPSVSYSEYLMKNRNEIEEDISASLLLPIMEKDSFLLQELAGENHRNGRFVEREFRESHKVNTAVLQVRSNLFEDIKYIAFVPLPMVDVETENTAYTVIGLKKKLKSQNASYISMMLFFMYIYFQAQHERGEHQKMYFSMISLMVSVIDAKDPVTAGHSQRVASISKDIGIWLKLGKSEQFDLEFTALLHDIGKIGVSDYVLNKQSVYTQNDFEQMKYHTIRGAEMLSEVGISAEIIDGVRHHHERIDGKGYPDGIKGEELSLFAKIIKIADVYDALTSKRQYKEAWETDKALDIIYRGRGTEFDSEIADVFIEHMSSPGWIPPVEENAEGHYKNLNVKKITKIVKDFYRKYSRYLSREYPIPSRKARKIDFTDSCGFMGYDWGETYNHAAFLENKPVILEYEESTKSLFFGQSSKGNGVSSIYYYFFKGFVNMGIYLLMPEDVKNIQEKLAVVFGEAHVINKEMMLFESDKAKIVYYHTADEKDLLFYISDYMASNYVFDNRSKNV